MTTKIRAKISKYRRYFSTLVIFIIVVPIIYVTNSQALPGRIIGAIFYIGVAYLALYEIVQHMHLMKVTKFLIPLLAIVIFLVPVGANHYLMIRVIEIGSVLKDQVEVIFNWQLFVLPALLLMFVFFDKKNQQNFLNMVATWILLIAITVGITFFLKTLYVINAQTNQRGWEIICLLVGITIISDTMAFFGGTLCGKHQLAPKISPHKTWEGAMIGFICATTFAFLFSYFCNIFDNSLLLLIIMSLLLPLASMFGDLTFSLLKRNINIKDFSNLIPGHGGIMDRLDSLALVVITFSFVFYIFMLVT